MSESNVRRVGGEHDQHGNRPGFATPWTSLWLTAIHIEHLGPWSNVQSREWRNLESMYKVPAQSLTLSQA